MMLYKSWQIWMCGSLVCHHVYYVFYYCFVCCTYPSYFPFFSFLTELSWKLIRNVYLNRGPNKLMLQCPSLLHQMYMLFIDWMYFICDNKLCWTWTCWTLNLKSLSEPMSIWCRLDPLRSCMYLTEIFLEIRMFSFKNVKMSSAKWLPFCSSLNTRYVIK